MMPWKSFVKTIAIILILGTGIFLRFRDSATVSLWVDEAESAINALSVLADGLPVDHYLGLPIYENTLLLKWPEHPEYEFRDISYSDRGLATYHGWLPLYAIAGSFKLFGIRPDTISESVQPRSIDELMLRTFAARFPSLLFSIGAIGAMFWAARSMLGAAAGWMALIASAVHPSMIWYGRQARYYSATVTLSIVALYALWRLAKYGRWRDVCFAAFSLVLLFYTHLATFAFALVVAVVAWVLFIQQEKKIPFAEIAVFGSIVTLACLPWIIFTDFLGTLGRVPAGWKYLSLPRDLIHPIHERLPYLIVLGAGAAVLFAILLAPRKFPRLCALFNDTKIALILCYTCLTVSWFGFHFVIPAASYFMERFTVSFVGPGILLFSLLIAASIRLLPNRRRAAMAVTLLIIFLATTGRLMAVLRRDHSDHHQEMQKLTAHLHALNATPNAKLYAAPNQHLVLTFYTGLPLQSVAPIRKSFLDCYEGPIVYVEPRHQELWDRAPGGEEIQEAGRASGIQVTDAEADSLAIEVRSQNLRERLASEAAVVNPTPKVLPSFADQRPPGLDLLIRERQTEFVSGAAIPMMQGYPLQSWTDWWQVFNYRFSEPESRIGCNANYKQRLRHSTATLVDGTGWVVFNSTRPVLAGCRDERTTQGRGLQGAVRKSIVLAP